MGATPPYVPSHRSLGGGGVTQVEPYSPVASTPLISSLHLAAGLALIWKPTQPQPQG
jgi:hypothetical protein